MEVPSSTIYHRMRGRLQRPGSFNGRHSWQRKNGFEQKRENGSELISRCVHHSLSFDLKRQWKTSTQILEEEMMLRKRVSHLDLLPVILNPGPGRDSDCDARMLAVTRICPPLAPCESELDKQLPAAPQFPPSPLVAIKPSSSP